ncbi:Protein of unknown function DUF677 [Dillenia turbinata]|uniref:Uncharacterized protein n=1 Tax=Dillenia turbinata TaxID=194707 RepID=A0AAN8VYV1_9MAGN
MWTRPRVSRINKDKDLTEARKSLNVNDEYLCALRTKSYADFFIKAQLLASKQMSPSLSCHHTFSERLLEPGQQTISAILESMTVFSTKPDLKSLFLDYFEISAEASKICSYILKSIMQVQLKYRYIQQALDGIQQDYTSEQFGMIFSELNSFVTVTNPFDGPNKLDFKLIHDKYSSVLHQLRSKKKKVARKIKLINFFKKTSGVCVTAACGMVAIAALVLAAHTLTALLLGPAMFCFPLKCLKRKVAGIKCLRSGHLRRVGDQLDVAAKGAYILNRDFDTMSRLVARLHDEIEHNKAMIRFCLERRELDKFSLVQVVKELRKRSEGFKQQVEELEEHVYLCLLTINRARGLVIKQITASCCVEDPVL